jgi:uncharacterized damage-inducible protein DinB
MGDNMKTLFHYNWMVRDDWYKWCEELTEEELLQKRTGGVGGILHTLFHIIDVEWSWIRILQGKPDFQEKFEEYNTLAKVRELDAQFHQDVEEFIRNWDESMETKVLQDTNADWTGETLTWGEVMRHTLVHEIHHIGQLSIWARELGKKPITANLIRRNLLVGQYNRNIG